MTTGTFYIWSGKIAYTLDTPETIAPSHYALFPRLVRAMFPCLDFQTRRELYRDSVYSLPRGRVVCKGEKDPRTGLYRRGTLTLFAGVECRPHEARLMRLFGLNDLDPALFRVTTDYSDAHYVTAKDGRWLVADVLRENQARFDSQPDEIHIPGIPRPEPDSSRLHLDDGGFSDKLEVLFASLAERLRELTDSFDEPDDDDERAAKKRK